MVVYNDATRNQAYPEFVIVYERVGPVLLKPFEPRAAIIKFPENADMVPCPLIFQSHTPYLISLEEYKLTIGKQGETRM